MHKDLADRCEAASGAHDCDNHTFYQPEGYIEWHGWAEEMSKTHVQRQCQGCGLYMIWEPKPAVRAEIERLKRSQALSDLIAGDADLYATKGDSDGDDGA